jgi:hypothetical protein
MCSTGRSPLALERQNLQTKGTPIHSIWKARFTDNDLAVGRIVQAISNSADWATSAIFIEEDDAQDGVDHVDGHRQPVQVISPYAVQSNGVGDHTTYTAASINRTIEQIRMVWYRQHF